MTIDNHTVQLLIQYRYWILVPLSVLESTIVAFLAGMLAAAGYFDIYFLGAFFFGRDIVVDLAYYALGHYGGKTRLARRMLKKMHITDENIDAVRTLWNAHPARTMIIGKLSYGIAASFIAVAGMVRMSLRKFLVYGSLAAVLQYGVLLLLGYFFGATYGGSIITIIQNIQYILVGLAVVLIAYYVIAFRMRHRMLAEDQKAEEQSDAGR